jgi:hypothetical protein
VPPGRGWRDAAVATLDTDETNLRAGRIPWVSESTHRASSMEGDRARLPPRLPDQFVLVVDDHDSRAMMRRLLNLHGFQVLTTPTGAEPAQAP